MKRLLRGLASPLESSRQSFFVCLVEFLRQNSVDYDNVSQEMRETLKVSGGTQGEESLYLLGQILADVALLRAERVKETGQYQQVLSRLSSQFHDFPWDRQSVCKVICYLES